MEIIIPSTSIFAIKGTATTYASARSTSDVSSSGIASVGQSYKAGPTYDVYRGFLSFDTSIIPQDALITDVKLRMQCSLDNSAANFNVNIVEQDWSAYDPIDSSNREAAYDACLAATHKAVWRNTLGMALNTDYTSPALTISYVDKSGFTYYSLSCY